MAIEIREVVVKATVHKSVGNSKADFVSKADLQKFQDKVMTKVLSKVKDLIEESRSSR